MNKAFLLLLLFCFPFYGCNTQNSEDSNQTSEIRSDSISIWVKQGRDINNTISERRQLLNKALHATKKIDSDNSKTQYFSRISLAYLRLKDSSLFRETNHITLELAKGTKDSTVQAEAYWDLAEFFRGYAINDSSYYNFSQAQRIFKHLDDDFNNARMLLNMALIQGDVKDYTGSEITTIRAIELLKPINKYKQLFSAYNNLGAVSSELKEYERAIEYYSTALKYQQRIENKNSLNLHTINNIGTIYQDKGAHLEAISYFKKILNAEKPSITDYELYATALNNYAYNKFKSGNITNVEQELNKSLAIRDSLGDMSGISSSLYSLAEYYCHSERDTVKALEKARKAEKFAKITGNNERLLQTLLLLAQLEPKKSSLHNREYIALNDSLQQEERKTRDKFARIRFETDEFIEENKMLAREKQLWAGIALTLLLLGGAAYVIIDQRSKNQKLRFQQEQQAANQEIFNLMLAQKQKVEEGKKSEQKRISEELHDGVLGKMLGARMVLTGLNKKTDPDAEVQRKKAIDALQDVEKEVRSISHELSHAAYQKMYNFILSLEDLLNTIGNTANINCKMVYDEEKDWDQLNGDVKINVYRMVQESLQNSVKHAQCQNVTVDLSTGQNQLQVSIADDGKGFKTTSRKKGIGMRNIASRVKKLNGTWQIKSAPGKGTTVTLEIPWVCNGGVMTKLSTEQQLVEET